MGNKSNNNTTVKNLFESGFKTIPNEYNFFHNFQDSNANLVGNAVDNIPIIDFSEVENSGKEIIEKLAKACEEWGFFILVNHGVPQSLMNGILKTCENFFNLPKNETKEYEGNDVLAHVRSGTSYSFLAEKTHFWRDFLKVIIHPTFNSPTKPDGFSSIAKEYGGHVRRIRDVLLRGILKSLEIEMADVKIDLKNGQQRLIANYYPPCPQPQLAIGLPPHSDHGLVTVLVHNQIGGLQIEHKGKWIAVESPSNAFLINVADQLEIITNGRYKSVLHRVMVNEKSTRVSVAIANGPALDDTVEPAASLKEPAKFSSLTYRRYLEIQQTKPLDGKSGLDLVRVQEAEENGMRPLNLQC